MSFIELQTLMCSRAIKRFRALAYFCEHSIKSTWVSTCALNSYNDNLLSNFGFLATLDGQKVETLSKYQEAEAPGSLYFHAQHQMNNLILKTCGFPLDTEDDFSDFHIVKLPQKPIFCKYLQYNHERCTRA